jgi:hypothetical protein
VNGNRKGKQENQPLNSPSSPSRLKVRRFYATGWWWTASYENTQAVSAYCFVQMLLVSDRV